MKYLLAFILILVNPLTALALEYQGSKVFIINQNGKKRILINSSLNNKLEVKTNTSESYSGYYSCGGYKQFILNINLKNFDKLIKIEHGGENINLANVPTFIHPGCYGNGLNSSRPNAWFDRGESKKSLYIKGTGQTTFTWQNNQIISINRCGFGYISEGKIMTKDDYGQEVEETIPLPSEFSIGSENFKTNILPTINSQLLPVCRVSKDKAITYVPINWGN